MQILVWENPPKMATKESNEHRGVKLSPFDCKKSLKKCETSQPKPNHNNNSESEQAVGTGGGHSGDKVERVIKNRQASDFQFLFPFLR